MNKQWHLLGSESATEALELAAHEREVKAVLVGLEDSKAGRLLPLADWEAKFRAKHNIRADVEPMTDQEARQVGL